MAALTPAVKMDNNKAQPRPVALFVSDVHLQSSMPRTLQTFLEFLGRHAMHARQLYLLGDLFEYWAGDDDLEAAINSTAIQALRDVSNAGVQVFWVAGNRDFLVGPAFASAAGLQLLPETHVVDIAGHKLVLLHGDAQCLEDQAYIAFRKQVRDPAWQRDFLALPLVRRKAIIDGMRAGSREAQRGKAYDIMDVSPSAIDAVFAATDADIMVHGHTHRPAVHAHRINNTTRTRYVLPDWDCDAHPRRGGWLTLYDDGTLQRTDLADEG